MNYVCMEIYSPNVFRIIYGRILRVLQKWVFFFKNIFDNTIYQFYKP